MMTDTEAEDVPGELEPCPFCGGKGEIVRKGSARQSMIIACVECGARVESGDVLGFTRPESWRWNRRSPAREVSPSPSAEVVEALKQVLALAVLKWGNLDPDANAVFDKARATLASLTQHHQTSPDVAAEIAAERRRQVEAEGWTPEHDDMHSDGALAVAGAAYAREAAIGATTKPWWWPWDAAWWKPVGGPRRMLIKAAALIVAEIERLDRAALASLTQDKERAG